MFITLQRHFTRITIGVCLLASTVTQLNAEQQNDQSTVQLDAELPAPQISNPLSSSAMADAVTNSDANTSAGIPDPVAPLETPAPRLFPGRRYYLLSDRGS